MSAEMDSVLQAAVDAGDGRVPAMRADAGSPIYEGRPGEQGASHRPKTDQS